MHYLGVGSLLLPDVAGIIVLLLIWNLFWKGFALWHAAKRGDKWWFIAMLIINTAGILEIVYLFFFAKIPEFRSKVGLSN